MEEHNSNIKHIKFTAFRAVEDRDACMQFVDGHRRVLEIFGITQITSARADWVLNPDVYVMLVTDADTGKALGGGRVHRANRINALPIEEAVGYMDEKIYKMVDDHTDAGTGEVAGVWNSFEIAGLGIGSNHLSTACVAYAKFINLTTLFGLAAPATYRNVVRGGFQVVKELGNDGKFYYPKDDMTATVMFNHDIVNLPLTTEPEKTNILDMRRDIISKKNIISKQNEKITLLFDLSKT
ncbi:MAG: hypothetical protein REI64_05040 [Pedobacter sp.]|uniref:hypothetical protein n=1 Tax=Pedobacter sp. TaxID=1411316 RepID=UPI00280994EF|nr:hypothetical protein [Pedobacter sp.]MDQ8004145.1 hypothetical protein [Pedobacter sp.]